MTGSGANAEVKANVDVRPVGSQVFLVACAIVAAISLICGAALIGVGNAAGWIFVLFAALILSAGLWGWRTSQSDTDLGKAHPTRIAWADGTTVTTDSRMLRSPEGVRGFIQVCDEVLSRQPLPAPDGLVDSSGQVIPGSKDDAIARATQINHATQAATNGILDVLNHAAEGPLVTQGPIDPTDNGPGNKLAHSSHAASPN